MKPAPGHPGGPPARGAILILIAAAILSSVAAAAAPLTIPLQRAAPRIDGDLGEEFWRKAAPTARFVSLETGRPSSQTVIAKIAATRKALYVGFICLGKGLDQDTFEIQLFPMAVYAKSDRERKAPPPKKGAAPKRAPAKNRLPGPDLFIRCLIDAEARTRVKGARAKAAAAARRLPGGMTVEVRLPFDGLVPNEYRPRPGDLWMANLILRSGRIAMSRRKK